MLRHFDDQLREVFQKIAVMGALTESMIELSMRYLVEQNEELARKVYDKEQEVNALQVEIDELAVRLTALNQPVARDVRALFMATRIVTDLERIGDQAKNICQNASFVHEDAVRKPLVDLPIMAEIAAKMVRDALTSVLNRDLSLAEGVMREEQRVDALRDQIFHTLLEGIPSDPQHVQRALSLILISRNLERIGDHATNIAEEAIYIVQGRDVRHEETFRARATGTPPPSAPNA